MKNAKLPFSPSLIIFVYEDASRYQYSLSVLTYRISLLEKVFFSPNFCLEKITSDLHMSYFPKIKLQIVSF
jgi:hypothetical protein